MAALLGQEKKGTAITLCCEDFAQHLERVEVYLKKKIPVAWAEEELYLEEKSGTPPARKRRRATATKAKTDSNNRSRNGKGAQRRRPYSRTRSTT